MGRKAFDVCITGGAGFVGCNLAVKLKQANENISIIVLDNLKRRGSELNLQRFKKHGIEFIHGDIRNKEDIDNIGQVKTIIESSAEPSVLAGYDGSPEYLINTNLVGTLNCLEHARKHQSDFIFLSTSRVYPIRVLNLLKYKESDTRFVLLDDQPVTGISSMGCTEEFPLNGTRSMYGATKLASEFIVQEYIEMYGLRGVINRCGVITGPWQMGKVDQGVVVLWAARHLYGGYLSYIGYGGAGKQVRDILHINDLYSLLDVQMKMIDGINGETFNVGGGVNSSVSLKELTGLCEKATGNVINIESVKDDRPADIRIYLTDNSKVKKVTGWSPKYTPEDIVTDIVIWLKENKDQLKPILSE